MTHDRPNELPALQREKEAAIREFNLLSDQAQVMIEELRSPLSEAERRTVRARCREITAAQFAAADRVFAVGYRYLDIANSMPI